MVAILYSFASMSHLPNIVGSLFDKLADMDTSCFATVMPVVHILWACSIFNRKPPENVLGLLEERLLTDMPIAWKGGGDIESKGVSVCIASLLKGFLHNRF